MLPKMFSVICTGRVCRYTKVFSHQSLKVLSEMVLFKFWLAFTVGTTAKF